MPGPNGPGYIVIKTIKGHRYLYRQWSWREPGRRGPRTKCRCLGRYDGSPMPANASPKHPAINTTPPRQLSIPFPSPRARPAAPLTRQSPSIVPAIVLSSTSGLNND